MSILGLCSFMSCTQAQNQQTKIQQKPHPKAQEVKVNSTAKVVTKRHPNELFNSKVQKHPKILEAESIIEGFNSKNLTPSNWLSLYQRNSSILVDIQNDMHLDYSIKSEIQTLLTQFDLFQVMGDSLWRKELLALVPLKDALLKDMIQSLDEGVDSSKLYESILALDSQARLYPLQQYFSVELNYNLTIESIKKYHKWQSSLDAAMAPRLSIHLDPISIYKALGDQSQEAFKLLGELPQQKYSMRYFNDNDSLIISNVKEIQQKTDDSKLKMWFEQYDAWLGRRSQNQDQDSSHFEKYLEQISKLPFDSTVIPFNEDYLDSISTYELYKLYQLVKLNNKVFPKDKLQNRMNTLLGDYSLDDYFLKELDFHQYEELIFSDKSLKLEDKQRKLIQLYLQTRQFEKLEYILANLEDTYIKTLKDLIQREYSSRAKLNWVPYLAHKSDSSGVLSLARIILSESPELDLAYETLMPYFEQQQWMTLLQEIEARHPYEERPVLWQAIFHKEKGDFKTSLALLNKAREIDPSDGGQEPGRRMRVYEELAYIESKLGNNENAQTWKQVVKAIRQGEEGDKYFKLGLKSQSLALYEKALNEFSDAYCIQSRLAVQYDKLGMKDKARQHYEKAFGLMPLSFGRKESHCFNCEGIFHTDMGREIALKSFEHTEQHNQSQEIKPKVYYLRGMVYNKADQHELALENFQQAIQLDSAYYNAWIHAYDLIEGKQAKEDFLIKILQKGWRTRSINQYLISTKKLGPYIDAIKSLPPKPILEIEDKELNRGESYSSFNKDVEFTLSENAYVKLYRAIIYSSQKK